MAGRWRTIGLGAAALAGGAVVLAALAGGRDDRAAEAAMAGLIARAEAAPPRYDPAMVADLPEIARRFFASAIAPGTPLRRVVALEMEGTFLLGERALPMTADQVLAPPDGFVWRARVGSGALRFAGSDGYLAGGDSWTRFLLLGLVPLVGAGATEDHARAAAARMAMETIWAPAGLLPAHGAVWRQTGADEAAITFPGIPGIEPIRLTLDAEGRVVEAVTQRWSDANPERAYRLQPFGGRMLAHARHDGFLIPVEMEIGNHYGTGNYAPFFRARLTRVRFLPDAG
jgi:hypothetical protein